MPGTKRERSPGKWTLTVTLGTDYKGKKRRFNKTFHGSSAEADKELALFYADCIRGSVRQASNMTVDQMVESYINDRPKGSLKKNTLSNYEQSKDIWISPFIGSLQIRKVSARILQEWVIDLSRQVSPKSVSNAVSLLSSSFTRMMRLGEIADNPCKRLVLPKLEKKEADYLDENEVKRFLAVLQTMDGDDLPYKLLFELALFCGLRKGELLGLDWQDIDLINCTVTVRQTRYLDRENHCMRVDTPKTSKSRRKVSFPPEIRTDFIRLRSFYSERQLLLDSRDNKTEWTDSPAVFRSPFGKPMYAEQPLKILHDLQRDHGLKRVTLHQLRHTNVSIMISMGLDIKTIQSRGGYSNANTPLNIYGHIFRDQDADVAGKIYDISTGKERTDDKRTTIAK